MTPLLSLQNTSKRYPDGGREVVVLKDVCLEIDPGVTVGVYGPRRAGKSTLLRIAIGLAPPDTGIVRFEGRDMAEMVGNEHAHLLRGQIAYVSPGDWSPNPGESVVNHVATALGSEGLTMRDARRRALQALERAEVGTADAEETTASLSFTTRAHVMLARALCRDPRLLVLDEPAVMSSASDRDKFYRLLRSVAQEREIALLVASQEVAALQGIGVLMSLDDGELISTEERGTVLRLPGRRRAVGERTAW